MQLSYMARATAAAAAPTAIATATTTASTTATSIQFALHCPAAQLVVVIKLQLAAADVTVVAVDNISDNGSYCSVLYSFAVSLSL